MVTEYAYDVCPNPKPRQTQKDRWALRPPVVRYRAFADDCRAAGITVENGDHIRFELPMPPSWSAKRRAETLGQPHLQTPDIDNLAKALLDAVLPSDCAIWLISLEKRWAEQGRIIVYRKKDTAGA